MFKKTLFVLFYLLSIHSAMAIDFNFKGKLVEVPCQLFAGSEAQMVDLGVADKNYLYRNKRSITHRFQIRLEQCDISIRKTLEIIFSGPESIAQPGLLMPDMQLNSAEGIAVGLRFLDKDLPLGKSTGALTLLSGTNVFNFTAFIQADPEAIKNKSIKEGLFNSTAQFSLIYP